MHRIIKISKRNKTPQRIGHFTKKDEAMYQAKVLNQNRRPDEMILVEDSKTTSF